MAFYVLLLLLLIPFPVAHEQSCSEAVLGQIVLWSPDKVSRSKTAAKLKVSTVAEVFTRQVMFIQSNTRETCRDHIT